jgi:hypothetical protein
MLLGFGFRIRHPFFPGLPAIPAGSARGRSLALAGTVAELMAAARRGVVVRRAIYVLIRPGEPFLADAGRDHLWEAFGVPAFALVLDAAGHPTAWECEAQNGLHRAAAALPAGLNYTARLEQSPCECGRPGERVFFEEPTELAIAADAAPRR